MIATVSVEPRRVLVTGAGGFLGKHLVGELVGAGHKVIAVSSQDESAIRSTWAETSSGYRDDLVTVVCTDDLFELSLTGCDIAVNAGFARVQQGIELAAGMDFQVRLLEKLHEDGVGRVVNVSSQSVYDPTRTVAAREGDPVCPTNPYATAKYAQELFADALLLNAEVMHLRLASLIGVGFDQRLVNKMVARAVETDQLTVTGGSQVFDFMDVRDAARAVALLSLAHMDASRDIVNVGSGQQHTLLQIAEAVSTALREERGSSVSVEVVESTAVSTSSALETSKLIQQYRFLPKFPLARTISDLVAQG